VVVVGYGRMFLVTKTILTVHTNHDAPLSVPWLEVEFVRYFEDDKIVDSSINHVHVQVSLEQICLRILGSFLIDTSGKYLLILHLIFSAKS